MERRQGEFPASDSVVITGRVSPETAEALRKIAARNYRSVSSHLRLLVEAEVEANASSTLGEAA